MKKAPLRSASVCTGSTQQHIKVPKIPPNRGHGRMNNITVEDEGVYRCRVDFKNSPARHNRAKLNVIGKIFTKFDKLSNDFKPI